MVYMILTEEDMTKLLLMNNKYVVLTFGSPFFRQTSVRFSPSATEVFPINSTSGAKKLK